MINKFIHFLIFVFLLRSWIIRILTKAQKDEEEQQQKKKKRYDSSDEDDDDDMYPSQCRNRNLHTMYAASSYEQKESKNKNKKKKMNEVEAQIENQVGDVVVSDSE